MKIIKIFMILILITLAIYLILGLIVENFSHPDESKIEVVVNQKYYKDEEVLKKAEESIPDSDYYDTIQDAMLHADIQFEGGKYQKKIDEIIKTFESENYIAVYYRSIKNSEEEGFTFVKFHKKEIEGEKKYAYLVSNSTVVTKRASYDKDYLLLVRNLLAFSDYLQKYNVNPSDTRFAYGISLTKEIYDLKVEGQSPAGIIPYKVLGKTFYFWYYENLESDKAGTELNAEFKK